MGQGKGRDPGMWNDVGSLKRGENGRGTDDEQTAENDQGKKVCFREDEQREETRAQGADNQDARSEASDGRDQREKCNVKRNVRKGEHGKH